MHARARARALDAVCVCVCDACVFLTGAQSWRAVVYSLLQSSSSSTSLSSSNRSSAKFVAACLTSIEAADWRKLPRIRIRRVSAVIADSSVRRAGASSFSPSLRALLALFYLAPVETSHIVDRRGAKERRETMFVLTRNSRDRTARYGTILATMLRPRCSENVSLAHRHSRAKFYRRVYCFSAHAAFSFMSAIFLKSDGRPRRLPPSGDAKSN